MNKNEIDSAYRVRFGRVTIDKEIGRGGKEIRRQWPVLREDTGEQVGIVVHQKLRDVPGYYPHKWVEGSESVPGRYLTGPRFDEMWQAVEWVL